MEFGIFDQLPRGTGQTSGNRYREFIEQCTLADTVGFDSVFDRLFGDIQRTESASGFPPYNIRKLSGDEYTIELAVAGFDEDDVDIELTGDTLEIKGTKSDDAQEGLIHHGLATRNFTRKFVLSEDMKVNGASLSNGILYIALVRVVPEHKKPKKIALVSKKKLLGK